VSGAGIVVGSMDTGFDPTHPALAGKWRGGTNSWKDFINGRTTPYDDHGHGTHTIGTMVGGDGPGPFPDDVGLAYGAKFISAKVLDATNSFSSASIVVAGAQWMLDPDQNPSTSDFPDVINNSWYFMNGGYTGFYASVAAWRAAGIVPVFCVGNNGPSARTTMAPSNYDNCIGVGATTSTNAIASFSGRGPSPSGTGFPADLRKPDLTAPGEMIRSCTHGTYEYWTGTSMAAPHVAGTIALMLQRRPNLTYAQIRTKLIASAADFGTAGYDYDFGYGRLNTFAAVSEAVGVDAASALPVAAFTAAPNPFRTSVRFTFTPPSTPASVDVFDLGGRRVWSARTAGAGALLWDGRDLNGGGLVIESLPACDQYTIQGDLFSRAILEDGEVPVPLEDSVKTMAVIDAVFLAAGTGRRESPVEVESRARGMSSGNSLAG